MTVVRIERFGGAYMSEDAMLPALGPFHARRKVVVLPFSNVKTRLWVIEMEGSTIKSFAGTYGGAF